MQPAESFIWTKFGVCRRLHINIGVELISTDTFSMIISYSYVLLLLHFSSAIIHYKYKHPADAFVILTTHNENHNNLGLGIPMKMLSLVISYISVRPEMLPLNVQ